MASVTELLGAAFAEAKAKQADLYQRWTSLGLRIGGLLPESALVANVQQHGDIDILLRALEGERSVIIGRDDAAADICSVQYQTTLSACWVSGFYEILRLLHQRKIVEGREDFIALHRDFELLRIPLDKHEIAKEKSLKEPLKLQRTSKVNDKDGDYIYDRAAPGRAHIMPCALSSRGSIMWHVIDVRENKSYWIERQGLSDRIVSFFDGKS